MAQTSQRSAAWSTYALRAAGIYNLAAATVAVLDPAWLLGLLGLPLTVPPGLALETWHALAALTAATGAGYLIIAGNPSRHWPVVLIGFLGKLATGAWAAADIVQHQLPASAWLWIGIDDAIWLVPFALILRQAHENLLAVRRTVSPDVLKFALRRRTQHGVTIDEISRLSPVLLVFLRHAGCPFCREALADLAAQRREIERNGARMVLVHMGSEEQGARFFARYGLSDVPRVSDPDRALYRAFGLPRGTFSDVIGPKVWWRGFQAGVLGRHGVGKLAGDGFQMPGVFLLFHGEIVRSYRHQSAGDRPDYLALVTGRDYAAPELRDQSA
jgi:peroxiredoxin